MFKGLLSLVVMGLAAFSFSCKEKVLSEVSSWHYHPPVYDSVSVELTGDTIHFALNDTTYNRVSCMNVFTDHGKEYFSFFDERSGSVNIYDFESYGIIRKILLAKVLPVKRLNKASVYSRNFDSIFVSNDMHRLFLIDSSGRVKDAITFPDKSREVAAVFENDRPLVLIDSLVYTGIRPSGLFKELDKLVEWKVLFKFDFRHNKATRYYHLPRDYRMQLYPYEYLDYSYCLNNRSNLVFSFPADSNLYEYDLASTNTAHFARSSFQAGIIKPVDKSDLGDDMGNKQFLLSDSYGPVLFDQYHKRYLRVFRKGLSEEEYDEKKHTQKSLIIFNESLEVVGEWVIPEGLSSSSIFVTAGGSIYTRINLKDEYALNFVRLTFKEKVGRSMQLASNDSLINRRP